MNRTYIILILILFILIACVYYLNRNSTPNLLPTPKIMVEACEKNGIPYKIMDKKHIEIGDGKTKLKFAGAVSNLNKSRPRHLAMNKRKCSSLLRELDIPVPKYQNYPGLKSEKDVERIINNLSIPYPLVVKPACGQSGVHIHVGIENESQLRKVLKSYIDLHHRKIKCDEVMVEEFVRGDNYRVLCYEDRILDIIKREIPYVIGDGKTSLGDLIKEWNTYREEFELYPMKVDWEYLKKQGIDRSTVIEDGIKFTVKQICGCCVCNYVKIDINSVHPKYLEDFKRVNKVTGLKFSGLDVIATDLSRYPNAKINEVNSAPSMRCHYFRDEGYLDRHRDLSIAIKLLELEKSN